ncbi:MAG: 16S rRNA methyltransferase [Chloroflexi bacterium]|nr:16S rRNA methyltransferase [Chloroflexota bacterium]
MSAEIVERVLRSPRYRDVDRALLTRLADEELPRSRGTDDAVKRVKRRLHQAVGAFRGRRAADPLPEAIRDAWTGNLSDPAFRAASADAMRAHASTRERIPLLDELYPAVWSVTGLPSSLMDLGCGLNPLTLPWMGLASDARYLASDVDRRPLAAVAAFLELVDQPGAVEVRDLVAAPPTDAADVALLFKLVTTLDRQDRNAASRLLETLAVRHAVITFPVRSLGGRGRGMERTYRARLDELMAGVDRVRDVTEVAVSGELVMVAELDG